MSTKRIGGALLLVSGMLLFGCKSDVDLSVPGGGVSFLFRVATPSKTGLDAMLQAVRARLDLMSHEGAMVSIHKDRLILVRIPGISEEEAVDVQRDLLQPTRLAFSSVESDTGFFNALKSRLPKDGSVRLGLDSCQSGVKYERIEYTYLVASRRQELQAFLDIVTPPEGRKFWIMPAEQGAVAYLLKHPPVLQDSTVTEVSVRKEEETGRATIFIELEEKHQQAFTDLTREQLHRRLAVLVDGEIRSLPMVDAVIQKAQLQIEPSPVTPDDTSEREAQALAAGIKAWGCAGGLSLVRQAVTPAS